MFKCEKKDCKFVECELWRHPAEKTFSDLQRVDEEGHFIPFDVADPDWKQPFLEIDGDEVGDSSARMPVRWSEEAMNCLTDRQRQAVNLYREGKTQAEIAKIMKVSQPRVHQILYGENGQGGAFRRLQRYFTRQS